MVHRRIVLFHHRDGESVSGVGKTIVYLGGPRGGGPPNDTEEVVGAEVPSQRIPVFEEPQDSSAVCADEQVARKLGHYEKVQVRYYYVWKEAQHG